MMKSLCLQCHSHAQPRATKNLDQFIRSNARNSAAVFKALAEYGAPLHGLTVKNLQGARTGLQIGVPPNRIDILLFCTSIPRFFVRVSVTSGGYRRAGHLQRDLISNNQKPSGNDDSNEQ